ncbi:uncharacterized protein TNCV_3881221 [Trichonephila clavipes]|nr:uncharacterized protein TNCV_3881221 [Trichonephila clavipes]
MSKAISITLNFGPDLHAFLSLGAPGDFHFIDWCLLSGSLIRRKGLRDKVCFAWPPHSPDLMQCDFYLWELIKNCVYVPLLTDDLPDLRHRIEAAVARINSDTLNKAYDEVSYQLDVCPVTNEAHIEHL